MKKTFLYEDHLSHDAKMVDFSGWSMPINYGSQIDEHHQVRNDVGIFDVSHMSIFKISGQNAESYLRYIFSNDVKNISSKNKALYGLLLNENAGIVDDLIVYCLEGDFIIVSNCATKEKNEAWYQKHASEFDVSVEYIDNQGILAVQGPNSIKVIENIFGGEASSLKTNECAKVDGVMIAKTGYTGEEGFEVICENKYLRKIWNSAIESGAKPIGLAARDTLRLEAGFCLYGSDMDESVNPHVCGLTWTVDLNDEDREFIGKQAFLNINEKDEQKMIGILLKDKGILRPGYEITHKNGKGTVLSGTFSPTLKKSIGLARVDQTVEKSGLVKIRNKELEIEFVSPRFLKKI